MHKTMKTKIEHSNINQILSKKLGLRILGIILLSLFLGNTFAAQSPTCAIKKQNGSSCYWTTLKSVTHNISGTYTITLLVEVDGSSGGDGGNGCQGLSHYAVQTITGTYSNVTWHKLTGDVGFEGIGVPVGGGNSQSFDTGFKLDNADNFGDGHAGSFTVTYTLTSLQNEKFAAKAGSYSNDASFTIADFTQVLNCSTPTGPTAVNDTKSTPLNTPVDITVLENDIAGSTAIDATKVTLGTQPGASVGVFTVSNTTGLVTFAPAHNYAGIATISYTIKDANSLSSTATISVTVLPAGPTAVNDTKSTALNTPVDITVLENDIAGSTAIDATKVTLGTQPVASIGAFSVNNITGVVTFIPAHNYAGLATINYTIKDANSISSTATISVTVLPAGPTAVNDTKSTALNTPVDITVLENDIAGSTAIDATKVTLGTQPATSIGVFSVNNITGVVTFIPAHNYAGLATISYTIKDANSLSSTATISVTVLPAGPTAVDNSTTTLLNTSVDVNVLANDIAGSTPIDITKVTFVAGTQSPSSSGNFTVNENGLVTFNPTTGFTGTTTINYQIVDGNQLTSIAKITVIVSTGSNNNFPATGFGTLAFEDLWPFKGDYDMNDLVLDYKFVINSNTNNYVDKVVGTFVIKAFGASLENGFGFQLPGIANASDLAVSGYSLTDGYINLNSNGTESGQTKPTIIVYDNAFKQMATPGGIGVNTDPNQPYVAPKTITITINFKPNTYTLNDLDIANFNPFLIVNKVRGVEVHLPDYAPTSLANSSLFGTGDDNSSVAQNRYYKTANNLPWAINTYGQFAYPKEKVDIIQVYLHFADWAISSGKSFQDWYKDLTGYRNTSLIYQIPQ